MLPWYEEPVDSKSMSALSMTSESTGCSLSSKSLMPTTWMPASITCHTAGEMDHGQ